MKDESYNYTVSKLYGDDITRYPLLKRDEEFELAKLAQKGDEEAIEKLVLHNLRFVVKLAHKYQNLGMEFEDLVSEGNQGLIKAAQRFDPDRGVKFSTYAAWWIKQTMRRGVSNRSKSIRLPVHIIEKIGRMNKFAKQLETELGREPTDEELCDASQISMPNLKQLRICSPPIISMDEKVSVGGVIDGISDKTLGDLIEDDNAIDPYLDFQRISLIQDVHKCLHLLEKRESDILKMRFGIGTDNQMTLEQIGSQFNLTRERIRQLERKAIRKVRVLLRQQDETEGVEDFIMNPIDMKKASPGILSPALEELSKFSNSIKDILQFLALKMALPSHLKRYL